MAYYHPRKTFGNEDVIYKARQYEKALQERLQFVQEYEGLMRYAQFEQANGPRACHHSLAERLEALRAQREQALLQRRCRLSALLSAEDASLKHDITTGSMNLSERRAWLLGEALSLSSRKAALHDDCAPPATSLETALSEDYDEISMHNSTLAIRRTEAEKQRQRDNEAIHKGLHEHADLVDLQDADKQAIDILREHLYMVDRLRDQEKAAVEEDMISMNKRWLEEQEVLKRKLLERRHQHSSQVRDALLCTGDIESSARESYEACHNMAAEKEAEEEKQLEELKEAHKKEALAYVCQLQVAAARQRKEDEELEAIIKAHMMMQQRHAHNYQLPADQAAEIRTNDAPKAQLSKQEYMADALQGGRRRCQAAELVHQEVKRLAVHADGDWKGPTAPSAPHESRMKHTMDLPYPEPYYGRKSVKWYQ